MDIMQGYDAIGLITGCMVIATVGLLWLLCQKHRQFLILMVSYVAAQSLITIFLILLMDNWSVALFWLIYSAVVVVYWASIHLTSARGKGRLFSIPAIFVWLVYIHAIEWLFEYLHIAFPKRGFAEAKTALLQLATTIREDYPSL